MHKTGSLLLLLLFFQVAHAQDTVVSSTELEEFNTIRNYAAQLPLNAEIEVFILSWPSDDLLCDQYNESQGDMDFFIYRDKKSGKIISVTEFGAYCQGDSDYGYSYLFDTDGYAIYSSEGWNPYVATEIKFYNKGKAVLNVEYSPTNDGPVQRTISKIHSDEVVTAAYFKRKINEYFESMRARLEELRKMNPNEMSPRQREEVKSLIKVLNEELRKGVVFENTHIFRKPHPDPEGWGESVLISGVDVKVHEAPDKKSEVIGTVSYFERWVTIVDLSEGQSMGSNGSHPWYKIKYEDYSSGELVEVEGWVFGAFISPDTYLND